MAKICKLSFTELDMMSIGMVFDHISMYVDITSPKQKDDKPKVRKATQADIDALKI